MTGYVLSIDAETNGLAGQAFCVAMTLHDPDGVEVSGALHRCPIMGSPHNPLYDCRAAYAAYAHLMEGR